MIAGVCFFIFKSGVENFNCPCATNIHVLFQELTLKQECLRSIFLVVLGSDSKISHSSSYEIPRHPQARISPVVLRSALYPWIPGPWIEKSLTLSWRGILAGAHLWILPLGSALDLVLGSDYSNPSRLTLSLFFFSTGFRLLDLNTGDIRLMETKVLNPFTTSGSFGPIHVAIHLSIQICLLDQLSTDRLKCRFILGEYFGWRIQCPMLT